jgi:hypothetical protein
MTVEAKPPEMTATLIGAAIALAAILILLLTRKHCTVRPRPCSGLGQGSSTVLGLFLLIAGGLMGSCGLCEVRTMQSWSAIYQVLHQCWQQLASRQLLDLSN